MANSPSGVPSSLACVSLIDWLNDNEGFATTVGTAVLVLVAAISFVATWKALGAARGANEIAQRHFDLERRRARGANVIVWAMGSPDSDGRIDFGINVRGPSMAHYLVLQLVVEGRRVGHELEFSRIVVLDAGKSREFNYQLIVGQDGVEAALDGKIGRLEGSCKNNDLEEEAVVSFPFTVVCPADDGRPAAFRALGKYPVEGP